MNTSQCPLVIEDVKSARNFLATLSFSELVNITEEISLKLSASQRVTYNINRYCSSYRDAEGRVAFILALINDSVISAVGVPLSVMRNPTLIQLIKPVVHEYYLPIAKGLVAEVAALTDDIVVAPKKQITITNPRWEHVDEGKKGSTPDVAAVGDVVKLFVDVTGIPEGSAVTFDIFDVTSEPPLRIATAKGKNEQGKGTGEWTVEDPNEKGEELKLEFEGVAKSKASGRGLIPLSENKNWGICKSPDGEIIVSCAFCILKDGEVVHTGETDSDGKIKVPFEYTDDYTIDFFEMENA